METAYIETTVPTHIRERMRMKIHHLGYRMPVMCSPEELMNDDETI